MACGEIAWWRAPDVAQMMLRYGEVEHLVIQFNFCCQAWRGPRAEYSIPHAAKSARTQPYRPPIRTDPTGYADLVCLETHQIWEIKPKRLAPAAAAEAGWYVNRARLSCGSAWELGTTFSVLRWYRKPDVVFRAQAPGVDAELHAWQGAPGAVLYEWVINGVPVPVLEPGLARDLRGAILFQFYPEHAVPALLARGGQAARYLRPEVGRGDCLPELADHAATLTAAIVAAGAPAVPEYRAVALLVDEAFYEALVGPRLVRERMATMAVPVTGSGRAAVEYARKLTDLVAEVVRLLAPMVAAGAIVLTGAVAVGALTASPTPAPVKVVGLAAAGGAVLVALETAAKAAPPPTGLAGTLSSSLAAQPTALRMASGGTLVVFGVPRGGADGSTTPTTLAAIVPKYVVLDRRQTESARPGGSVTVEGATWYIAALARPRPDAGP
ncbi:hypothetical protein ACWEVD_16940 [Nocardia thailandica]